MAVGFPPQIAYPAALDSNYSLFLVYNTTETVLTADNQPWSDIILIQPVTGLEIWADNGFANLDGELLYYDAVEKDNNGKVYKLKHCARNLGGQSTKFNIAGTSIRGFVVAEHHNQLTDAIIAVESFVGENFSTNPITLDYRIRNLQNTPDIFDDFNCPAVDFTFTTISDDPASGVLIQYSIDIRGQFTGFVLDFGDGTSTTALAAGTHRYAPNAKIDPVLTLTNSQCQVVQTAITRTFAEQPQPQQVAQQLIVPVPEPFTLQPITITAFSIPSVQLNMPPVVFPCFEVSPFGISIPSIINIIPPLILPSFIGFASLTLPSITIGFEQLSVPSIEFGPFPSVAPLHFDPFPSVPLIHIDPFPSMPVLSFAPFPSIPPVSIDISFPSTILNVNLPSEVLFLNMPSFPSEISFINVPSFPDAISFTGPPIPSTISWVNNPVIPNTISIINIISYSGVISIIPPATLPVVEFGTPPAFPFVQVAVPPAWPFIEVLEPVWPELSIADPTFFISLEQPSWALSVVVTIACPSQASFTGIAPFDNSLDSDYELAYDFVGFPSEIKVLPPEIADVKLIHDLPEFIDIRVPSRFPDVHLVDRLPSVIHFDAHIPSVIHFAMPVSFPKVQFEVPQLPSRIEIFGIDTIKIEHNLPSLIKVEMPEKPEVTMKWPEDPMPVKVQVEMVNHLGQAADNIQCFGLVPCPR